LDVSHDLQEPLRAVAGYVKLLQRRFRQNADAKAREYIGGALEGVQRMDSLIRDLLAFARVSEHTEFVALADLGAVLDKALHTLQIRIKSARAKVTRNALPTMAARLNS
jgi:light-regulated signal transduction histidine kinase (bacteriophytochrome)